MRYPESRVVDAVEELAGVTTPDPYRWLSSSVGVLPDMSIPE